MCRRRPSRRAFVLAELLVAVAILAIVATLALGAWARSQEAGALKQGEMQLAAVLRDAIARTEKGTPGMVAEVVWSIGSGQLTEYTAPSSGYAWTSVLPAGGISLTLPSGVTVLSYTGFAINAMRVFNGDTSTGTYEGFGASSWSGAITLETTHQMTATVHVTGAGTVWY